MMIVSSPRAGRVFSQGVPPDPSSLETAISNLVADEDAAFAQTSGHSDAAIAWQTTFHPDISRGVVHVLGKAANNDTNWSHRIYTIATDTWSSVTLSLNSTGHIYGNSCIDPATGDVYLQIASDKHTQVYTASTATWGAIANPIAFPTVGSWTHACGVAWHPNLYGVGDGGLVVGVASNLAFWRKSTGLWQYDEDTLVTSLGDNAGSAEYFPLIDAAVLGRGNFAIVTPNGSAPSIAEAAPPIQCGGLSTAFNLPFGAIINHPSQDKLLLLERLGDQRMWETTDAETWTPADPHPFSGWGILGEIDLSHGAIWAIGGSYSQIWRV